MDRTRLPLLVLLLGTLCLGPAPARAQVQEPALKAAFVYNFILFTTWPADIDARGVRLCIGADHVLAAAVAELHGKPVGKGRVSVYRWSGEASLDACHVAVVGAAGPHAEPALAEALARGAILTISDGGSVGSNGAIVVLVREDSRVRFDVDARLAAQARLALSSRLLRLARRVL